MIYASIRRIGPEPDRFDSMVWLPGRHQCGLIAIFWTAGAWKFIALQGAMMSMMKEFREFAVKGNVIDLAVGVIIGAAFGKIVDSLVKDIIMPVVSTLVGGKLDFSNLFVVLGSLPADYKGAMTYADLTKAGVPLLAWGNFVTILLNFILLAFVIFQMVKVVNRARERMAAEPVPAPAEPPPTPEDVALLREIRDLLRK
jgi:large conductance mechanosensitive channel